MFVHGAGTGPVTYQPMIESLASRGYVVAAPAFPEARTPTSSGPNGPSSSPSRRPRTSSW